MMEPKNVRRTTEEFLPDRIRVFALWMVGILALSPTRLPAQVKQATPTEASSHASGQPTAKAFSSPEVAAAALYAAARRNDETELLAILGPNGREIIEWSDDPNERQAQREQFAQKYDQMHRLRKEPDDTVTLYVGAENWPLPIPLVEYSGAWYFDAELGRQEIRYRRIGRNEVQALEVCHALVDAEKQYFADAHQYTDKFSSSNGSHDGLYWKGTDAAKKSPIGPYLAHAGMAQSDSGSHTPYFGYYYRILLERGPATGTAAESKTGEFSILAFPAEYRSSGMMTFLVDESGKAYQKDLGPTTATLSKQITSSKPDSTWKEVE